MYYTASSVINALTNHPNISVDNTDPSFPFPVPSCPKRSSSSANCSRYFPKCDGENVGCSQKFRLKNKKGNPIILELFYYIDRQNREGRIKKQNATLKLIILRYGLDVNILTDA